VPSQKPLAPGTYEMRGQFLTNKPVKEKSITYAIAKRMPNGALFHPHSNQQLPVKELLKSCKDIDTMFIRNKRVSEMVT